MGAAHGEGAATVSAIDKSAAEELLFREALHLDRRDWDAWLALYAEDAVFWVPAWRDEASPTEDPDSELSLIYYRGRRNLEERVWRIRSGLSVASAPLPRSVHTISNVLVERAGADGASVSASFAVHLNDVRAEREHVFFGRYEYRLVAGAAGLLIASKKILLLNDRIPTVLDVYLV
jgi:3-phenylpropionate/cinnamic acid dioxygenase small subunit